jgi:hypothetical protein
MPRSCAYCGATSKLTREEVFPDFLRRSNPSYSKVLSAIRRDLVTPKSPSIKDVCAKCNNESLSRLDEYAATFCKTQLRRFVKSGDTGQVSYDYHLFTRWLWKVSYNGARNGDADPTPFHALCPYILGETARPPTPQMLLAGIIAADHTTPAEKERLRSPFLFPKCVRMGTHHLDQHEDLFRVMRFISINSFIFALFSWVAGVSRRRRRTVEAKLARAHGLTPLREGCRTVQVAESRIGVREYLSVGTWSDRILRVQ